MSGNFVQRGQAAVFPKHYRARAAIDAGAALVLQIPVSVSLSSAEFFARGAVNLLSAMNVHAIAFGSESGDIAPLSEAAKVLDGAENDGVIKREMKNGVSYAAAKQKILDNALGSASQVLKTPNNMLAVEYIRAINAVNPAITPITVPREPDISSSRERERLIAGRAPGDTPYPVRTSDLEQAITALLRTVPLETMQNTHGGGDGCAERLYKAARAYGTLAEIENAVKTKRFVMSRVKRLILRCALGLREVSADVSHIRVLGLQSEYSYLLNGVTVPVITKPASAKSRGGGIYNDFLAEVNATDLYNLAYPSASMRSGGAEWEISPIRR